MADAAVPDKVVGVHRGIGITSAALLFDVAADGHTPRESKYKATAISEVVMVEVRGCRICAAIQVILEGTIDVRFDLPPALPVPSVGETRPFVEVAAAGLVLYRHFVLTSVEVLDGVRKADLRVRVDAPILLLVERRVEIERS